MEEQNKIVGYLNNLKKQLEGESALSEESRNRLKKIREYLENPKAPCRSCTLLEGHSELLWCGLNINNRKPNSKRFVSYTFEEVSERYNGKCPDQIEISTGGEA